MLWSVKHIGHVTKKPETVKTIVNNYYVVNLCDLFVSVVNAGSTNVLQSIITKLNSFTSRPTYKGVTF